MDFYPRRRKAGEQPTIHRTTVKRLNPDELEQPVNDLIKRGYVVVKRGTHCAEDMGLAFRKSAILTSNLRSNEKKLLGASDNITHYVILERENEHATNP